MVHQQHLTTEQSTKSESTRREPAGNFQGFRSPNYTMVPDELFDEVMADLSGAELKVLLYIIRRTYGFKKQSDDISLNQICHGITTRGGQVLDHGTGLSRSTVKVALQTLLARNIIIAAHRASSQHGYEATTYQLNIAAPESKPGQDPPGLKIGLAPWAENRPSPGPETSLALGRKSALQETVEQQTVFDVDSMAPPPKRISRTIRRGSSSPAGVQRIVGEQEPAESVSVPTMSSVQHSTELAQAVGTPQAANDHADITAETANQRRSSDAAALPESPTPPALIEAMRALSQELGDDARPASSITRAHNLLRRSGLSLQAFLDLLDEAAARTRAHRATILKRQQGHPVRNCMPYLFAVLQRLPDQPAELPDPPAVERGQRHRSTSVAQKGKSGADRYTGGAYGVCPQCLCIPCDLDCPTQTEKASDVVDTSASESRSNGSRSTGKETP